MSRSRPTRSGLLRIVVQVGVRRNHAAAEAPGYRPIRQASAAADPRHELTVGMLISQPLNSQVAYPRRAAIVPVTDSDGGRR